MNSKERNSRVMDSQEKDEEIKKINEDLKPYLTEPIRKMSFENSYGSAKEILNSISDCSGPIQKTRYLLKVTEGIVAEINEFFGRIKPRPQFHLKDKELLKYFFTLSLFPISRTCQCSSNTSAASFLKTSKLQFTATT
jgi:hypothetical protein